jgi:phenylpyruvate tautomerase
MPLITVRTSLPAVEDASALLQDLSAALAQQTGKPEAYVMTLLEAGVPMTFAGSAAPCAYVEIKSIGALKPPAMTAAFCDLISGRTGIAPDRIYVAFEDVKASSWGWNGRTFG